MSRGLPTVPCLLVPQIINEDVAKKTCEDHQLCVVAVLPHILDTGMMDRNSVPVHGSVLPALTALSESVNGTHSCIFIFKSFVCLNQELQAEILIWKFF